MANAVNGWHHGEEMIHEKLGLSDVTRMSYLTIQSFLPEQHQTFYSHNLHFMPLTTLDSQGRPWVSLLSGTDGKPGFIQSPTEAKLVMDLKLWPGDPFIRNLELEDPSSIEHSKKILSAGIGIEFSTRRRNKFAGRIDGIRKTSELTYQIQLSVNQAIG